MTVVSPEPGILLADLAILRVSVLIIMGGVEAAKDAQHQERPPGPVFLLLSPSFTTVSSFFLFTSVFRVFSCAAHRLGNRHEGDRQPRDGCYE